MSESNCVLGIDLGTSGIRVCAVDMRGEVIADARSGQQTMASPHPGWFEQSPRWWWQDVQNLVRSLPESVRKNVTAICVDGTSSTLLLCNDKGKPLTPAIMYNDSRAGSESKRIRDVAPNKSAAHGASSSLAKLLWLLHHHDCHEATHALHQADWISGCFTHQWYHSDYNNALKLGYDVYREYWPLWLIRNKQVHKLLPKVHPPGSVIASIAAPVAESLGLSKRVNIHAGTTDSIAAFIASGAKNIGEAVTSLGSTLVLKVLSQKAVFSPDYGIYSHKLGNRWLVGGASNTGGAVLAHYFSAKELQKLSAAINPEKPSGLDYYPLLQAGERFPVNDEKLPPRISPIPEKNPVQFLHGLLEGISNIEQLGYQRLAELGAPYPQCVFTAGGGAQNPQWTHIRQEKLGCPIYPAQQTQAAYGAAKLALDAIKSAAIKPPPKI